MLCQILCCYHRHLSRKAFVGIGCGSKVVVAGNGNYLGCSSLPRRCIAFATSMQELVRALSGTHMSTRFGRQGLPAIPRQQRLNGVGTKACPCPRCRGCSRAMRPSGQGVVLTHLVP